MSSVLRTKRHHSEIDTNEDSNEHEVLLNVIGQLKSSANSMSSLAAQQSVDLTTPPDEKQAALLEATDGAAALCVTLRSANRASQLRVEREKHASLASMAKLDNVNLLLQNLVYEQNHYENEIAAARAFVFEPDSLNLWSEAELLEQQPTALDSAATPHAVMLARLAAELAERKRLQQRVEELKKQCTEKRQRNTEVEKCLLGLNVQLKALGATSLTFQQMLQQTSTNSSSSSTTAAASNATTTAAALGASPLVTPEERLAASLLPTPLYSLFVHVRGFRDAVDREFDARIEGDVNTVAQQRSSATATTTTATTSTTTTTSNENALDVHPLAVVVDVPLDTGGQRASVRFHWISKLQLVTAFVVLRKSIHFGIFIYNVIIIIIIIFL